MKSFLIRLISLLAVVAAVVCYNLVQINRDNEDQIAQLTAQLETDELIIEAYAAAEESASTEIGQYADGVYEGEGEGFGGTISVEVMIEEGEISDIEITGADGEDGAYLDNALAIIDDIIEAQSADVDTISGATFSSTGIRDAVSMALEEAEEAQAEVAASAASDADTDTEEGTEEAYADGTYSGEGEGFGGTISVEVTIEEGEITAIEITGADGEDGAYLDNAESIIDDIIEAQSADVDTISGATFSSTGIRDAVSEALEEAAN